jgi:hypothetical protein
MEEKKAAGYKETGCGLLLPLQNCISRYPKMEGSMVTVAEREGANNGETKVERGRRSAVSQNSPFLVSISIEGRETRLYSDSGFQHYPTTWEPQVGPLGETTKTERATVFQTHCPFGLHMTTPNSGAVSTTPYRVRQLDSTVSPTSIFEANALGDGWPLASRTCCYFVHTILAVAAKLLPSFLLPPFSSCLPFFFTFPPSTLSHLSTPSSP